MRKSIFVSPGFSLSCWWEKALRMRRRYSRGNFEMLRTHRNDIRLLLTGNLTLTLKSLLLTSKVLRPGIPWPHSHFQNQPTRWRSLVWQTFSVPLDWVWESSMNCWPSSCSLGDSEWLQAVKSRSWLRRSSRSPSSCCKLWNESVPQLAAVYWSLLVEPWSDPRCAQSGHAFETLQSLTFCGPNESSPWSPWLC